MGIAGTPEILRAVTHWSFLPPHLLTTGLAGRGSQYHLHIAGWASLSLIAGIKMGPTELGTERISKSRAPKRMRKNNRI